jgi:hypothetical protein
MDSVTDIEVERLREVQRECARQHREATTQAQRDWHMLGIADYFMEELMILYPRAGRSPYQDLTDAAFRRMISE